MVAIFTRWVCEESNMTSDDIIRMARETGIPIEIDWAGRPSTLVIKDGGTYLRGIDDLERFAELVAAAEREACAKVCDDNAITMPKSEYAEACQDCAYIIRARGEK
jgi:hypothetical protein